jgi:tricorn protease interacting factor F2/3
VSASPGPSIDEYRLKLDLDYAGLGWSGSVAFEAPRGLERLALDCEGLEVAGLRIGGRRTPFAYDRSAHRLAFDVAAGGSRSVEIDFSGKVETKNLFGLYRSRQGDGYVLTTHCEPTGARRIFPCLDRPDHKARIRLTVRAPAELEVISNTPPERTAVEDGHRTWAFAPTPEMSSYLFYLGAGRFDSRSETSGPVAVRVAAPPGRGEYGSWALRSAGRILRAYADYYGIPYPLPKLDLIAIEEHAFGAMENWGAISFQESRLLVDAGSTTYSTHDVFTTTAHEIAHQWFGNLVTMSWWDDIWLNESFAALMETKVTDVLEPSFDPWVDFLLRVAGKAAALDGDSLRSTHPVRARVSSPEELSQIFDEISYGKGSSVLAMFDRYLGEERFRAGVTDYLQRFRFRNARTEDLLEALERSSGEPVRQLATPWIDRSGLPVVRAERTDGGLRLRQARFSYHGTTDESPWPIPLVYEVDGRPHRILFDQREQRLEAAPGAAVLLNPGSIGFYRVLYDPPLLARLLEVLPARPARDAWAVLDDLSAFLLSGDVDWAAYDRAVGAFADASARLTVETIAGSLTSFALLYPAATAVGATARSFLARQTARLGLDKRSGEGPSDGIVRDRLAFGRVRVDPAFAEELSPRFDAWTSLDPDLRSAVAIARVRAGGAAGRRAVRTALDRAPSAIEALRFARALAWSPEPDGVREVLELAGAGKLNRSHVRGVVAQAAANPRGRDVAWSWLQENLGTLTEMFHGSGYLPLVLEDNLPVVGLGRAGEVRRFFDGREVPEGTRGLAKGLERLELLERLRTRLG